jgi:hypothetical protein
MRKKFDFILVGINSIITYFFFTQTYKYIDNIIVSLHNNIANPPKLSAIFFELQTKMLCIFGFGVLYVCSIMVFTSLYHKYFKSK